MSVSTSAALPKKRTRVNGAVMAHVDVGSGAPMVFLHGNPTSSYLWRNIMRPLSTNFRCLAPDLIGMGDLDKLVPSGPSATRSRASRFPGRISRVDGVRRTARAGRPRLGFRARVRLGSPAPGSRARHLAYMEAIVGMRSWEDFPLASRPIFQAFRSPAGERLVLEENAFVEQVLPGAILRKLTEAEHDEYRRPFREPGESRRPRAVVAATAAHRGRAEGDLRAGRSLRGLPRAVVDPEALRQRRSGHPRWPGARHIVGAGRTSER